MKTETSQMPESKALNKATVVPRFLPQPSDIEKQMKKNLIGREIDDEFGWTGEWRLSAKEVLDLIIDLQN